MELEKEYIKQQAEKYKTLCVCTEERFCNPCKVVILLQRGYKK